MNGCIRYRFGRFVSCANGYLVLVLVLLALLSPASRVWAEVPNTWYGDATLNDVHFVDEDRCVGA